MKHRQISSDERVSVCVLSCMYELLRTILADLSLVRLVDESSKYIICQPSLRGLRKGAHSFEDTYRSAFGGVLLVVSKA